MSSASRTSAISTEPPHEFAATYDSLTTILSAVVAAFLLIAVIWTKSAILLFIALMIVFLGFAFSPRGYSISGPELVVKRLIGNVRIPLAGVRALRRCTKDDFRGCIRLWGSGGFFGYYGLFRTSKLGTSSWYLTHRRNTVVMITDAKTVLLSPDDVDGFLSAVHKVAPIAETAVIANPQSPASSHRYGGLIGATLAVATAVTGVALALFAIRYDPGPPKYSLDHEKLMIRDLFYPVTLNRADVDLMHVRVVDLESDREWIPTVRTNGFANSHYRSGWFRLGNGQKIRLYSAGSRRLILLPPLGTGSVVLLEASDPAEFVRELQNEW